MLARIAKHTGHTPEDVQGCAAQPYGYELPPQRKRLIDCCGKRAAGIVAGPGLDACNLRVHL